MTVTVLPDQVGAEPSRPRSVPSVLRVNLLQQPLGLPPAQSVLDKPPNLFWPVDIPLSGANLLEQLGGDLHADH